MEKGGGREKDIDLLAHITKFIAGKSFCPFGEASVWGLQSNLAKFRPEFESYIELTNPEEIGADAFQSAPSTGPDTGKPSVLQRGGPCESEGDSPLNR